jgi:hypothetical protein
MLPHLSEPEESNMISSTLARLATSVLAACACFSASAPASAQTTQPAASHDSSQPHIVSAPIRVRVLEQSPAETATGLQIICLFRSDASNSLHGSLVELNTKLNGLLDQIRKPTLFRGDLGETLLLDSPPSTIAAKRILIIGLGDSDSFTPERMELVGSIAYFESARLGVSYPFFAPTILDGGVTRFATGDVAQHMLAGFFRASHTQVALRNAGASQAPFIVELTFLAGPKYADSTRDGIKKAIAADTSP